MCVVPRVTASASVSAASSSPPTLVVEESSSIGKVHSAFLRSAHDEGRGAPWPTCPRTCVAGTLTPSSVTGHVDEARMPSLFSVRPTSLSMSLI